MKGNAKENEKKEIRKRDNEVKISKIERQVEYIWNLNKEWIKKERKCE